MKIKLDGKNSESEKNGKGCPGPHSGPFGDEKENPESK
jgi:hypothetical protein